MKIREGKAFGIVQFGLGIGIHGISVEHAFANVHAFCRQGYIERIGCRTHGEHKAAAGNEIPYFLHHCQLQLRYFTIAESSCGLILHSYVVYVPLLVAIRCPEFAELPRKVFMVQVKPIIQGQNSVQHFFVIDNIIRNFRIRQYQGNGIVPRHFILGRIDSNLGGFLKFDHVLIDFRLCYFRNDAAILFIADHVITYSSQATKVFHFLACSHGKCSAFVIQHPIHIVLHGQSLICHTVCFEVVFLCFVHRNHQISGIYPKRYNRQYEKYEFRKNFRLHRT